MYMRGTKYYYVKMNRGKRHFVPLADSQGRPVVDLADAIRAAGKVAVNPFVGGPESLRDVLDEFFKEKLRRREWEATTKRGHRHIYETFVTSVTKPLGAVTTRDLQERYDAQRARVSDRSAATYFACIASLFRWAHGARRIPHLVRVPARHRREDLGHHGSGPEPDDNLITGGVLIEDARK